MSSVAHSRIYIGSWSERKIWLDPLNCPGSFRSFRFEQSAILRSCRRARFCASQRTLNRLQHLKPQKAKVVKTKSSRACPVCGTPFTGELCPVCVLRGALGSEETVSQSVGPTLSPSELRFEHYEVLTCDDGTPLELGRGAMGVTYKALDVNLRCAVALKVINVQFIGDESARRRFLREPRPAASVRNTNRASVNCWSQRSRPSDGQVRRRTLLTAGP